MSTIYVALSVSLQECFSISELTVKKKFNTDIFCKIRDYYTILSIS